jgi:hypothetical protein
VRVLRSDPCVTDGRPERIAFLVEIWGVADGARHGAKTVFDSPGVAMVAALRKQASRSTIRPGQRTTFR